MKKLVEEWRSTIFLGFGIILLALFLRTYNITSLPVFADEAIYIRWAQVMRAEPSLRFLPLSDGKQPLFMWAVIPMFKLFSDPLVAGRIVSVLTGLGTLVGVFALTLLLFKSKKAALVASLIYAISPFAVFFDRIGLVDSMLAMFGVWLLFFATLTTRSLRLDYAMISGFALGGALLTKSPAVFFVILLPSVWLLAKWPKKLSGIFSRFVKSFGLLLPTLVIGYGMYNILRLGTNFHLIGTRNKDYVLPISHLWTNPRDPFIFHMDRVLEWFWALGPSFLVIAFFLALVSGLLKRNKETFVLGLWVFIPIMVQSMYAKAFTTRYVLFTLAPGIILAASLFAKENAFYKKRKVLLEILIAGFVAHALWFNYVLLNDAEKANLPRVMRSGYLEEWTSGTGIRETAEILESELVSNPDEKIVVGTEGYFGTLPDGLQMYLNHRPEITVIGVGLNLNEVPSSLLESKEAGNKTYLVINSTRLKASPEELGLELVAAFPKAIRPEGVESFVHHGPQETLYLFKL